MEGKLQILESVPLLATVGEEALGGLSDQAEFVTLKKDEVVVREGEKGDGFYVVVFRPSRRRTAMPNAST
jgi:CRP-like cAMP-binding protein